MPSFNFVKRLIDLIPLNDNSYKLLNVDNETLRYYTCQNDLLILLTDLEISEYNKSLFSDKKKEQHKL